jgi:hypothetical protein
VSEPNLTDWQNVDWMAFSQDQNLLPGGSGSGSSHMTGGDSENFYDMGASYVGSYPALFFYQELHTLAV